MPYSPKDDPDSPMNTGGWDSFPKPSPEPDHTFEVYDPTTETHSRRVYLKLEDGSYVA